MAQFIAKVNGRSKTQASRLGTKNSGISSVTASWEGCVRVEMWHTSTGVDMVRVTREPWQGSKGKTIVLYDGPVKQED